MTAYFLSTLVLSTSWNLYSSPILQLHKVKRGVAVGLPWITPPSGQGCTYVSEGAGVSGKGP